MQKDEAKELEWAWQFTQRILVGLVCLVLVIPNVVVLILLLEHIPGFSTLAMHIGQDIAEYITGIRPAAEIISPTPVKYIVAWLIAGWVIDLVALSCFAWYAKRWLEKIAIIVQAYNDEHQPIRQQRRAP